VRSEGAKNSAFWGKGNEDNFRKERFNRKRGKEGG